MKRYEFAEVDVDSRLQDISEIFEMLNRYGKQGWWIVNVMRLGRRTIYTMQRELA